MTVIGYKRSEFKGNDGTLVRGVNIYCTYPLGKGGEGVGVERIYLTDSRLEQCGYAPIIGDEIVVQYNKYGKPSAITVA